MTQLLVSVKDIIETRIALNARVDIIDLKDPRNGALGALDLALSAQIVSEIRQFNQVIDTDIQRTSALISATVGECHHTIQALIESIQQRAHLGINIIKVAVSTLESMPNWSDHLAKFVLASDKPIKLVAVFFADQAYDLTVLALLQNVGFYGAMLDTNNKTQNLLEICPISALQTFTQTCKKYALKSGLAGSLKPQHIECLSRINTFYIGFRGGLCESNLRNNGLAINKVANVKELLQKHNKLNDLARQHSSLALLS